MVFIRATEHVIETVASCAYSLTRYPVSALLLISHIRKGGSDERQPDEQDVTEFLDALASSAPAPGGGSVAALSGAMGAALVSMVCNLTLGKKKYADVQDDITALVAQSEALRHELADLLEADVEAFTGVSHAYKMPAGDR